MRYQDRSRLASSQWLIENPLVQMLFGVLVAALLQYNWLLLQYAASLHWNDFGKFYHAALNFRSGTSLYAPTVATDMAIGQTRMQYLDMNPPHFHLLIYPFLDWSERTAGWIWVALNVVTGVGATAVALNEVRPRMQVWHALPLVALFLASAATGGNAVTAQCTGVLLLPLVLAWKAARHDRWEVSGAWLGVLISIKPFLGLFFPALLIIRQWRALGAAALTGLAFTMLGLVVFGLPSYLEWLKTLGNVSWVWAGMNGSLQGLLVKCFSGAPLLTPIWKAESLIAPLWLLSCLGVLIVSASALRRSTDHLFAVTILASLLISPLGWVYYLWLAGPACAGLWRERVAPEAWIGAILSCMPLFALEVGQPHSIATLTIAASYVWATLALWIGVVRAQA